MPAFAIGQKAYLIITPGGNLLWDCLPYIDAATVGFIQSKGGLKGIAISHPHFYGIMALWAETFKCPIYTHLADKRWIMDDDKNIALWDGDTFSLWRNMKIVHAGGHFAGSAVLHAPDVGKYGSLFVGDTLQIAPSLKFISMMYSYPNVIPLPLKSIERIYTTLEPLQYDAMFGAFEWQTIPTGAKELLKNSIDFYQSL